jgi:sugar phosphate isomerase/epimerase
MKHKLSVSTLAFQGWELEDVLCICREKGIDALEIRMGFHSWSDISLPDSFYHELSDKIQSQSLKVSDLGTSIRMIGYKPEGLKELERVSQIANILQCKGLRVMLGNRHKRHSDKVLPIDYEGLVRWLEEADEILEKYHTQIWIETHDEFATGKAQSELLRQRNFRNIYSLWDIMHPLEARETPEETLGYLKEHLVHVHIKDGIPWGNPDMWSWKYTRLGQGQIPIEQIVKMICASGYEGYFSLEWESAWREEIRGEGFAIPQMIEDFCEQMKRIL